MPKPLPPFPNFIGLSYNNRIHIAMATWKNPIWRAECNEAISLMPNSVQEKRFPLDDTSKFEFPACKRCFDA